MASEDSDQLMPGLFSVHRLSDFGNRRKPETGAMTAAIDQVHTPRELLESRC